MANDFDERFELAKDLVELRARKEELSKETKQNNEAIDIKEEMIIERLANSPISTVIFKGIGRITLSTQSFPRVKDQTMLFEYLRNNGAGDMIKETVNPQTLRGYWNDLKKTTGTTPDPSSVGLEVYTENRVSLEKQ